MNEKPPRLIKCISCGREYLYSRKYRAGHTTTNCNTCVTLARHRRLKKKLVERKGGKCIRCGYDKYIGALTFHHRSPKEKEFNLAHSLNRAWEKLKKETDKCDLLCANCHAEEHSNKVD